MVFNRSGSLGRKRPQAVAASMLLVGTLALTACGADEGKKSVEGSSAAASTSLNSSWQKDNFSKYYEQEIAWRQCTSEDGLDEELRAALDESGADASKFQCGRVKAPMDWASPEDGREIDVAVVRIPTTGNAKDAVPMFTNPGGPGVGGVQHAMLVSTDPSFAKVRENHEVWGFDPRGVGKSTPVQCESTSDIRVVQVAECADKYPLAHFMGSSQVARDMEMLRNLAGGKRLDYLGYSYGTMLGATYATLFPENAGRMVLDSAEASKWATLTNNYDQMVAGTKAIGKLAGRCAQLKTTDGAKVRCPFTSERELINFRKALDEKPLKSTDGKELNGADLRTYLTSALYSGAQGDALDLLGRVKSGNQAAIDELVGKVENESAQIDTVGQMIVCPSFPKTADVSALIAHIKKVGVPELLGGPEITDELLSEFSDMDCSALPETGTELTDFHADNTDNPLMVVGVTGDHATPYQHSKELVRELGNAVLVTMEGEGHGISFSDKSKCVDDIAVDYLVNGKTPKEGTVCQPNPEA